MLFLRKEHWSVVLMAPLLRQLVVTALAGLAIISVDATTLADDHLDLICSNGLYPGFQVSHFQYDIPVQKFFDATDSFFKGEWYVSSITFSSSRCINCSWSRAFHLYSPSSIWPRKGPITSSVPLVKQISRASFSRKSSYNFLDLQRSWSSPINSYPRHSTSAIRSRFSRLHIQSNIEPGVFVQERRPISVTPRRSALINQRLHTMPMFDSISRFSMRWLLGLVERSSMETVPCVCPGCQVFSFAMS